MKKIPFLISLIWVVGIASGQSVWDRIPLTGSDAKILPLPNQTRFNICLTAVSPLGSAVIQQIEFATLQNAAFSPGTASQLFEKLGGEFFVGEPSGPNQNLKMGGETRVMPGLRLGLRLGKRFELRAGGQYFKTKWSGEFPVTVLPADPQSKFTTLQGQANVVATGFLADADLAFFFAKGMFRPYLKSGVRSRFPMQNSSKADIVGIALPLDPQPLGIQFSPFGGIGLRAVFWEKGFVELGAAFGKMPDGGFQPTLETGLGWSF